MSTNPTDVKDSPKRYPFKVNGVELHSTHESLPASAILILAVEHDAIAGNPEEYLLEGDKGKYEAGSVVDLGEDNIFIAIPNKATPVAI